MKNLTLLLLFIFCSCSQKMEKTLDPILKTEIFLKAIQENKHEQIQNEIFGVDKGLVDKSENTKQAILAMDTIIKNDLKKYGFPKKTQITFKEEKQIASKLYREIYKKDSINIIIANAKLGSGEKSVNIAYTVNENNLEILYYEPN